MRLNGLFAPEDGEFVLSTFDSITSPRRGGVRFVDTERAAWATRIQDDPRSTEQIAADSLVQLLKIAADADPGRVLGGRRPAVRVIMTETAAHGQIEGNPVPVSQDTIDRVRCDTGTRTITLDPGGQIINVGRTAYSSATPTTYYCTTNTGPSSEPKPNTGSGHPPTSTRNRH